MNFKKTYKNLVLIGSGTEGNVFRTKSVKTDSFVVLKNATNIKKNDIKKIIKEKEKLVNTRFSGVPAIFNIFQYKKSIWTEMEWIEGIPLDMIISKNIGETTKIYIGKKICNILSEIHKKGWTHRDLKPSNILLTKNGDVYLTDLGFAKSEKTTEQNSSITGTPNYMAPELFLQEPCDFKKVDIYALGVTLYVLFTGKLPTDKETNTNIAELFPSQEVFEHVSLCLAQDASKRPESPNILEKLLEENSYTESEETAQNLAETVTPIFKKHISASCVKTAKQILTKNSKETYTLLSEALNTDPENTEAMELIEHLPAQNTKIKLSGKLIWIISFSVFLFGLIGYFLLKHQNNTTPKLPQTDYGIKFERKELFVNGKEKSKITLNKKEVFLVKEKENIGFVLIDKTQETYLLYVDNKQTPCKNGFMNIPLTVGEHHIKVINDSLVLFENTVKIALLETTKVNVN